MVPNLLSFRTFRAYGVLDENELLRISNMSCRPGTCSLRSLRAGISVTGGQAVCYTRPRDAGGFRVSSACRLLPDQSMTSEHDVSAALGRRGRMCGQSSTASVTALRPCAA